MPKVIGIDLGTTNSVIATMEAGEPTVLENAEGSPAPRGVPQIEVTFDIDANGILNVSAKDKASGKEQHITIQPTSGLSKNEIKRMVREAEEHAGEDQRRREEAELKNRTDNLAYQAERMLRESGDRVPSEVKLEIENQVQAIRRALEQNDVSTLRGASESLEQAMQRASQAAEAQGEPVGAASGGQSSSSDTVEGEFREV